MQGEAMEDAAVRAAEGDGRALPAVRGRIVMILSLLAGLNVMVWLLAFFAFHRFGLLLGLATLAYTYGLRHAVDADHISAIDNVTRKLMQDGQRPVGVGFFFSLGHSTIVILLSAFIAITAAHLKADSELQRVGGIVGTSVSAVFLLLIAGINAFVLWGVVRAFGRVRRGEPFEEAAADGGLPAGIMGRILRPVLRVADKSWKMYFVGFLFGLGFDTATEVGLLGISAAAATQGLPIWSIMIFPLLFTAGMCLLDTADGILMLGAYGWAYVHPMRKLYYNMTITSVSVLVAVVVGGIEVLGLLADQFHLQGRFWDGVGTVNDRFQLVGLAIVGIFILSWAGSTMMYRWMGYAALEAEGDSVALQRR